MIPLEDPTTLSQLFHLNSEPWLNDDAYRNAAYHQDFKEIGSPAKAIALPAPAPSALSQLIRRRRSCRAYQPRPMPLASLAALAAAAYGAVEDAEGTPQAGFLRRSVPSAGGLFPLEVYAFVQRVDDLPDGLYHYDVRGHALELVRSCDAFAELQPALYTHPFVQDANVVLCLAAVFPRTQKKYGPRGYRYILLEAGHSVQNFCLCAAELELGSLCMGGFVDSRLNRLLGLDPKNEGVVYAAAAGYSAEQPG